MTGAADPAVLTEALRRELCATGRLLAAAGLVTGTSGNLSARLGELVVVTPAGVALDALEPDDCPVLDLAGNRLAGTLDPTSETSLHLGVYRTTFAGAAVHTHSRDAVAVASVRTELPPLHYTALALGGTVRVAPYATYGTPELAESVLTALDGKSAALMANHGALAIGPDLTRARDNAELLEWLCGVYIRASQLGEPRVLTEAELVAVIERSARPWRPEGT
ncbi:class II aldolase/adducin family protein [Allonocardiopsis opalescens]|uniref:L-fuculose 1-phosphate aldolase n=1 Tax=Allonocardiopsis opalescens TaxID=1144618 RepID=A0A2T0QAC0_9ACTN|nr:class II aldolase/adducin family protein [Allonocardiopsis opalescens]PRY00819.1 L-fuculose 1-phosphate aldolase [Allonocardiopsis opalescens]